MARWEIIVWATVQVEKFFAGTAWLPGKGCQSGCGVRIPDQAAGQPWRGIVFL